MLFQHCAKRKRFVLSIRVFYGLVKLALHALTLVALNTLIELVVVLVLDNLTALVDNIELLSDRFLKTGG
ncbi:MAG: hypothetical protein ACK521_00650 [bacterium]